MQEKKKKSRTWVGYLLVCPAFLVMLAVVIIPICNSVLLSFQGEDGGLTWDNYLYFLTDDASIRNILFTLKVAVFTIVLALFISYALALYLRFPTSRVSRLVGHLYLLPRFVPSMVAVYAVINIVKDSGLINRISLLFEQNIKPGFLFDDKGIILVNLWFSIPFATMMLLAGLSGVSDSLVESARDAGASSRQIFTKLLLPLTFKDIMITGTFIFMSQIGAFTIPYLVGPNNPRCWAWPYFSSRAPMPTIQKRWPCL